MKKTSLSTLGAIAGLTLFPTALSKAPEKESKKGIEPTSFSFAKSTTGKVQKTLSWEDVQALNVQGISVLEPSFSPFQEKWEKHPHTDFTNEKGEVFTRMCLTTPHGEEVVLITNISDLKKEKPVDSEIKALLEGRDSWSLGTVDRDDGIMVLGEDSGTGNCHAFTLNPFLDLEDDVWLEGNKTDLNDNKNPFEAVLKERFISLGAIEIDYFKSQKLARETLKTEIENNEMLQPYDIVVFTGKQKDPESVDIKNPNIIKRQVHSGRIINVHRNGETVHYIISKRGKGEVYILPVLSVFLDYLSKGIDGIEVYRDKEPMVSQKGEPIISLIDKN